MKETMKNIGIMIKKRWISIVAVIAGITALFSLIMIVSDLIAAKREKDAFEKLREIVEERKNDPSPDHEEHEESDPRTESGMLLKYAALYEQNQDFYGWLRIDGTTIDYPVMYTPEDSQFYLRRSFDKKNSQGGTPFMDGACYEGCGNYLIYGHRMNNGTMFEPLLKYKSEDYWKEHKTLTFDTLYERETYEIIAAFYGRILSSEEKGFRYYEYMDLTNPAIFEEYTEGVRESAIYDTGIEARYGDELITLSTCSYHTDDGRFAIVAKKIQR